MNEQLFVTLKALPTDPTRVVSLYELLFGGEFIDLVADPVQPMAALSFLTYPASGDVRELPVFTAPDRRLVSEVQQMAPEAVAVTLAGPELWPRLSDRGWRRKTWNLRRGRSPASVRWSAWLGRGCGKLGGMSLDAAVYADDEQDELVESIWIGNIVLVAALREEVGTLAGDYPLVLGRVLYNGVHCGDEIDAASVGALKAELLRLPDGSDYLQRFRTELLGLCELALERGKPIVF